MLFAAGMLVPTNLERSNHDLDTFACFSFPHALFHRMFFKVVSASTQFSVVVVSLICFCYQQLVER